MSETYYESVLTSTDVMNIIQSTATTVADIDVASYSAVQLVTTDAINTLTTSGVIENLDKDDQNLVSHVSSDHWLEEKRTVNPNLMTTSENTDLYMKSNIDNRYLTVFDDSQLPYTQ